MRVLHQAQLWNHLCGKDRVRHDPLVVVGNELLDHGQWLSLKLLSHLRVDLGDIGQVIDPHILVADVLKDFAGDLAELVALCMDKVTKVSACAAGGSVVVAAWHGAIVDWVDDLVWVRGRGQCLLGLLLLVGLFEFVH